MTRAYIAVVIDGIVYAAYINHDGYPDCIAPRLMNGYLNPDDPEKNLRKIKTLCTSGEIAHIGSYIKTTGFGITYRDEEPSKVFQNLDDFAIFIGRSLVDYCYLFKDGHRYFIHPIRYYEADVKSFDRLIWEPLPESYMDGEYAPL